MAPRGAEEVEECGLIIDMQTAAHAGQGWLPPARLRRREKVLSKTIESNGAQSTAGTRRAVQNLKAGKAMSEFNFLPKAIEMVKQAVAEDNAEHYDKAKFLYTQSLEYVGQSFFPRQMNPRVLAAHSTSHASP